MRAALLALPLPLLVAACGSEPQPAPSPTPTAVTTAEGLRTLVAAGFDEQELGPRIVRPQGDEVESTVTFEGADIATVVSYVACPAPVDDLEPDAQVAEECNPELQAEDAVYTYVHRVTPGEGADGPLFLFRTSRRATGFANVIGYDRAQAEAALGADYSIAVASDNGQLVWRIEAGDGWDAGEEITLFWQSNLPPEGPSEAYLVENVTGLASATGPFPPAEAREEPEEPAAND